MAACSITLPSIVSRLSARAVQTIIINYASTMIDYCSIGEAGLLCNVFFLNTKSLKVKYSKVKLQHKHTFLSGLLK